MGTCTRNDIKQYKLLSWAATSEWKNRGLFKKEVFVKNPELVNLVKEQPDSSETSYFSVYCPQAV